MQTADCRLQTVQSVQTVQTECYFFYLYLNLAWVALGKFLEKFVYLAVEICHQETLPSATPSFPVGKKNCETEKHQRYRSAWVGQADFGKLELNNRNHSGNCHCLSVKRDQSETRSV